MPHMRARHKVFGVKDVPDNAFYRRNGWTPVDPDTPTTAQERRAAVNAARRGGTSVPAPEQPGDLFDPGEHIAEDVVAYLATADADERERVLDAERSGKARKTVLEED